MTKHSSVPSTKQVPTTETLHGHVIHDDYRWLEDVTSGEVDAWMTEQTEYAREQHKAHTNLKDWEARTAAYFKVDTESLPVRKGGRYFFVRRRAEDDLGIVYVKEGENGEPRVLLDPNKRHTDAGDFSLDSWSPSSDGKLLSYTFSIGGAEIHSVAVMYVDGGGDLEDAIPNAEFMVWNDTATGYYYVRGPKPGSVPDNDLRMNSKLYFHTLGTHYQDDRMIFGEGRPADDMLSLSRKKGAPYSVLSVEQNWTKNDLYLINAKTHEVTPFIIGEEALFSGTALKDGIIIWTNQQANNAKLLFLDYKDLAKGISAARTIVPEGDHLFQYYWLSKSRIFVEYVKDISDVVQVFDYDGNLQGDFPAPSLATIGLRTSLEDDIVYAAIQTPVSPTTAYKVNAISLESKVTMRTEAPHNPDDYTAYIEWTTAKDGTRMPMIIAHRKDLVRAGKNPTMLYGYGGFGSSEDPGYIGAYIAWLEQGGVYVDAVIRGGGEYGEEWHKAGILENKQTSFDDFIAHAENLIDLKITDREHLGIFGGSNGGLLVGAVGVQRPDLFKAVMSIVPLLDMVHFHTLLIASRWTNEYGNPEVKADLDRIMTWSPYHRIDPDQKYPAFYLVTADNDTRVHPMHALKMTAKLQNVKNPSLTMLWVDRGSGHTSAVRKSRYIEAVARRMAFFDWQLNEKA